MCWGVLAKVVSVDGIFAEVDFGGTRVKAIVACEGVEPGDVVIVHAGAIISRVSREELLENLSIYFELMRIHYEFNGFDSSKASELAKRDIAELAKSLGLGERDIEELLAKLSVPTPPSLEEGSVSSASGDEG